MSDRLKLSFMETNVAYVGVGSNLGDKKEYCLNGIEELNQIEGVTVEKRSSLYLSAPLGEEKQEWFINAVVRLRTSLSPQDLLFALHLIEARFQRSRDARWAPRTLDLDLLFYDQLILNKDHLCIPHPEAHKRSFVLLPLVEIAPRFLHPQMQKTMREIWQDLPEKTECYPLPSAEGTAPDPGAFANEKSLFLKTLLP